MIALYRAVATEYAEAFAAQARGSPRGLRSWRMQLAAQLRLELDMGAEPAKLRGYWWRAWRRDFGILWPKEIARARGIGQGAAEIVALATAAQAFQICAGTVKLEKTGRDGVTRGTAVGVKSDDGGLKDVFNKIYGVVAGGVVGTAALGFLHIGAFFDVLVGLAGAVASTAGLNFSAKWQAESERTTAYKFLPDKSLETLDRDVPLVIQRLRDAGLAPVFVIDELDKLPEHEDTYKQIGAMIEGLKLLTTDHGFFCFLTDRTYFERVQARAQTRTYAKEHTNFSHRLLVQYSARDFLNLVYENLDGVTLRDWLAGLLAPEALTPEVLEALIFAAEIVHKSELNFIEVERRLAAAWDEKVPQGVAARFNPARAESRIHAIVQLAISHVWRNGALPGRAAGDANFAQVAADALYMISRRWRQDTYEFLDLGAEAIKAYLLGRLTGDGQAGEPEGAAATLGDYEISRNDQNILVDSVRLLASLLADFQVLRTQLMSGAAPLPREDTPLLAVFESFRGKALLKHVGELKYEFLLDEFGESILLRDGMRPDEVMNPGARDDVEAMLGYMNEFTAVLAEVGIGFDGLVAARALPRLAWESVPGLCSRLAGGLERNKGYLGMTADYEALEPCRDALRERARPLALSLMLGVAVAEQANPRQASPEPPSPGCQLVPVERQLGTAWLAMSGGDEAGREGLPALLEKLVPNVAGRDAMLAGDFSDLDMMKHWRSGLGAWRAANRAVPRRDGGLMTKTAWIRWYWWVLAFFATAGEGQPTLPDSEFEDLILHAVGVAPGGLLRRDLGGMTKLEWSSLALEGAMAACGAGDGAPVWAMVAGLRALGMDASKIRMAAGLVDPKPHFTSPDGAVEALLVGGGGGEKGILVVVKDHALPPGAPTPDIASIYVDGSDMERYGPALNWLREAGLYNEVFDER